MIKLHGSDKATGFSPVRQAARFDVFLRAIRSLDNQPGHILDIGCNVGDFFRHLKFLQEDDPGKPLLFSYSGIDLNPQFIRIAKRRYTGAKFYCADALSVKGFELLKKLSPNIVVASGIFCYPERENFSKKLLVRLFGCAKSAVIVNFLSSEVTRKSNLIRYKADEVIEMARKCRCESFELWHSYLDNDMTLIMRKNYSHDCWNPST